MKSFIAAAAFFVAVLVLSGLVYESTGRSATDAFARESARVEHPAATDGRLRWASAADRPVDR